MTSLPAAMVWRHVAAREGFEVAFSRNHADGMSIRGCTAAVENDSAWTVSYEISLDTHGHVQSVSVQSMCATGSVAAELALGPDGRWLVDGTRAPALDGCLDIDLESSALTNAFPIRRRSWVAGVAADVPAAYVRVPSLDVERLEQQYTLLESADGVARYGYFAPAFDFKVELTYDASSLVIDYPGLAVRVI